MYFETSSLALIACVLSIIGAYCLPKSSDRLVTVLLTVVWSAVYVSTLFYRNPQHDLESVLFPTCNMAFLVGCLLRQARLRAKAAKVGSPELSQQ